MEKRGSYYRFLTGRLVNTVVVTSFLLTVTLAFCSSFCFSQEQSPQVILWLLENSNISLPEAVLKDLLDGKSTTHVIVNLHDPMAISQAQDGSSFYSSCPQSQTPSAEVGPVQNFKDTAFRQQLQQKVCAAQEHVINSLDADEVRVTNRFTHTFGFSAEVTLRGLQALIDSPDVLSVVDASSNCCSRFYENFGDGVADNWVNDGSGTWTVESGVYKMTGSNGDTTRSTYYNGDSSNFVYEARIKKTSGDIYTYMGVFFRSSDGAQDNNAYFFNINPNGQYSYGKYVGSTLNWLSGGWIYHAAINTGLNAWNTLRVWARGSSIKLYCNDTLLVSFTDSSHHSGKVGLAGWDDPSENNVFWFDDVRVWCPAELSGDFNGDGNDDILWRNYSTGQTYVWLMNGTSISSQGSPGTVSDLSWHIEQAGDFNGDGKTDILWYNDSTGQTYIWLMNGTTITSQGLPGTVSDLNWHIEQAGDFNGDGKTDILWYNDSTGQTYIWLMNGTAISSLGLPGTVSDLNWGIRQGADFNGDGKTDIFNGDGKTDILWRNDSTGQTYVWLMNGTSISSQGSPGTVSDLNWHIIGINDFDGDIDSISDILWYNDSTGQTYIWLMNGTTITSQGLPGTVSDLNWHVDRVGDFNGDGKTDILWYNDSTGQTYIWLMNGTAISSLGLPGTVSDLNWHVDRVGDFNGDGKTDVLWYNESTGQTYIWLMNGTAISSQGSPGTVSDLEWEIL